MKCCEYGHGIIFTTLPFLRNFQNGPNMLECFSLASLSIDCYNLTLKLIGLIHMLQRKLSAVSMPHGIVFTTLPVLRNLQYGPIVS
jgi:hypothetical protein